MYYFLLMGYCSLPAYIAAVYISDSLSSSLQVQAANGNWKLGDTKAMQIQVLCKYKRNGHDNVLSTLSYTLITL